MNKVPKICCKIVTACPFSICKPNIIWENSNRSSVSQSCTLEPSETLQKWEVAACELCRPCWAVRTNVVAVGSWTKMAATNLENWYRLTSLLQSQSSVPDCSESSHKNQRWWNLFPYKFLDQILSHDHGYTCQYLYPRHNHGVALGKKPIWHSQFPSYWK